VVAIHTISVGIQEAIGRPESTAVVREALIHGVPVHKGGTDGDGAGDGRDVEVRDVADL
jgi:hypothetical protein